MLIRRLGGLPEAPCPDTACDGEVVVAKPIVKRIVEWDEYTGRLEAINFVEIRAVSVGFSRRFISTKAISSRRAICCGHRRKAIRVGQFAGLKRRCKTAQGQLGPSRVGTRSERSRPKKKWKPILILEEQRYRRAEQIVGTNAISQEEFDIRKSTLEQAKAKSTRRPPMSPRPALPSKLPPRQLRAQRRNSTRPRSNLNYTKVNAPISGRVSSRYVTEGNLISGGTADSTLLTTIVSLDPIHVVFDADEAAFLKYSRLADVGKTRKFALCEEPHLSFAGR